jgi:flagellum-specific peptidoglycan hydrolase FlgJ
MKAILLIISFAAIMVSLTGIKFSLPQLYKQPIVQQKSTDTIKSYNIIKPPIAQIDTSFSLAPSEVSSLKESKTIEYINKYAPIAKKEAIRGVPAYITIAQGIIESNSGQSVLFLKNHNSFGIKCFSNTCKKGHCSNYTDETHKCFFRIYKNTEESFAAHTNLLLSKHYQSLAYINKNDYKAYCNELQNLHYATDPSYAKKLIAVIEKYKLYNL